MNISEFNKYFCKLGVTGEKSEVKEECLYALKQFNELNSPFQWINEWN